MDLSRPILRPRRPGHPAPSTLVTVLGLVTSILILSLFGHMTWSSHQRLYAARQAEHERLAEGLEAHVASMVAQAAVALAAVTERLEHDAPHLQPFDAEFEQFLGRLVKDTPLIGSMRVLNASGHYVQVFPRHPPAGLSVLEREYFIAQKAGHGGLHVGVPFLSRIDGQWLIPVSVPLARPGEPFAGVAAAMLRADRLAELFEPLRPKPQGGVALFRRDGVLLARAPYDPNIEGQSFAAGPLFATHLASAHRGTFTDVTAVDSKLRQVSWASTPGSQLVVSISMAYDDMAEAWLRAGGPLVVIGVALAAACAWGTRALAQQLRARELSERLLANRSAELELANEELRELARLSAHDLQEPLRTVLSYAQLLVRRFSADAESREYLDYLKGGVERMRVQLTALQRYLALDRDAIGTMGRVALSQVMEAAMQRLELALDEAGAQIVHDELPEVWGDHVQLAGLFIHLLDDALRYRRPDSPLRVEVSALRREGEWLLTVRDDGRPLAARSPDDPFRMFQRPAAHSGSGAEPPGLGLALCRKIVHLHGGRMWAEAPAEGGAAYHFTLPCAPAQAAIGVPA